MFFHCPKCKKVESSQRGVFQRVDLDFMHRCGFCSKSTAVTSWTCQCGSQWHSCHTHRGGYVLMPMGDPITAKLINGQPSTPGLHRCGPTSRKRALNTSGGIRQAPKRCKGIVARGVKRTLTVTLGDTQRRLMRPTRLGPILRERFGGASACSSA